MNGRGPQPHCTTADLCDLGQVTWLQLMALVLFVTVVTSIFFSAGEFFRNVSPKPKCKQLLNGGVFINCWALLVIEDQCRVKARASNQRQV